MNLLEKMLKEILTKLEKLDILEADIKELKELKELKPRIEETHQLVKALEHRTETMSATLERMDNQLAHLAGDVEAIKTSHEKDQLYVLGRIGKCEKDIYELKQGAGR